MKAEVLLFLSMRVLHVVLAAIWFGAVFFNTLFLAPVVMQTGPAGGQVMTALVRKGMVAFMASVGGMTIVTGVYLFWRFTGGFDPAVSASRAGMAYSIGALAGLIALILGGSVMGRSAKRIVALGEQMSSAPEAQQSGMVNEMSALKGRMTSTGKIVLGLLFIALATMALGHYV
ncbi:MAG: hypothetical protein ND807_07475 [Vicinamibacterales bacterium]|nr:hypothetical protein [Vicinamibacterales bacterium]